MLCMYIYIYIIIIYKIFSFLHKGHNTLTLNQLLIHGAWKKCLPGHLNTMISSPSLMFSVHIAHCVLCLSPAIKVGKLLTISGSIPNCE